MLDILKFNPIFKPTLWGSETWVVSAVKDSESVVLNGEDKGLTLPEVVQRYGAEFLGKANTARFGTDFPLLIKFIDARQDLSIQVHPNDELSARRHGKMGKNEMWYVIDAKPGSFLYAGFNQKITPYEYQKRVEDGSITEVLARHEVTAGDVFYLPAGRVHAICGGILLAEVQQSSDITYRIFDYNRPGIDGKLRELHTDLAAEAINYEVLDDYRTQYEDAQNRANAVLRCPFFSVRITDVSSIFHRNLLKYDSFIISTCISGDCRIVSRVNGSEIFLREGNSTLIPTSIADYDVIPESDSCRLLDSFIDNKDMSLGAMATRFLRITDR